MKAGGTVKVSLTATVENGWKLYAINQPEGAEQTLSIEIGKGAPVTIAREQIGAPLPKEYNDKTLGMNLRYYDGAAHFALPITVSKRAPAGKLHVPLSVRFQACTDDICLVPFTQKLGVDLTIAK